MKKWQLATVNKKVFNDWITFIPTVQYQKLYFYSTNAFEITLEFLMFHVQFIFVKGEKNG